MFCVVTNEYRYNKNYNITVNSKELIVCHRIPHAIDEVTYKAMSL